MGGGEEEEEAIMERPKKTNRIYSSKNGYLFLKG